MIPLVNEPKVVVWIEDSCLKGLATNISPDLFFTLTSSQQDFETYTEGLPFKNSELDWLSKKGEEGWQPPDSDAA